MTAPVRHPVVPRPATRTKASAPAANEPVEELRARVTAVIPEYHVVHVETAEGRGLALTDRTHGIKLSQLRVGQLLDCVVTLSQPRVLQARTVA
jgi:hypothetical protein